MSVFTLMVSFVGLYENGMKTVHFGEELLERSKLGPRCGLDEQKKPKMEAFGVSLS